ncbi:transposase [Paenibacillus sp. IB182496]|uniref:Transposase n=1 Tax=Paenibacillus sabuli TaxID=2772509 RepID=A0A927BWU4_9BACL|nr:transposase [Paenibacillus sabuli]
MERLSTLSKDATYYQYQLVQKVPVRPELIASYAIMALMLGGMLAAVYSVTGIFAWLIGLPATMLLQWLIVRLTMLRVDEPEDRRWGWRWRLPWLGYLPIRYAEHALMRRLNRHLLGLGLSAIAVAYPWASEALMISLVAWHCWLLAPRLLLLRKLRRARRDGVLQLHEQEVTFHHR